MKLGRTLGVLSLLVPLLASHARADSVVVDPPHDCRAAPVAAWSQDGKRTVAVALTALARLTCESYVVPRALAARSVAFAIGKERMPVSQLRERVAQRLSEGLGVELAHDARLFRLATTAGDAASPVPLPRQLARGIQCAADRCELDRALFDRIFADTDGLSRSVRIVPKIENGAAIGFQLFGIRPDGVVGLLGFLNGDVVTQVNGIAIGSPDKALAAYSTLRAADEIVVEGRRRDAALRITIVVRQATAK